MGPFDERLALLGDSGSGRAEDGREEEGAGTFALGLTAGGTGTGAAAEELGRAELLPGLSAPVISMKSTKKNPSFHSFTMVKTCWPYSRLLAEYMRNWR